MDELDEIKQRLDALETRRVHQSDLPPGTIKQRHLEEGISLSETFISDPLLTDISIDSRTYINTGLSITFTPTLSSKFLIFCNIAVYLASVDEYGMLQLLNTSGNGIPNAIQESRFYTSPGGQDTKPCYVYSIYTLIKEKEYVFSLQGLSSAGALNINSSLTTNGYYIIAQSL